MKKVIVLLGEQVSALDFQCGGSNVSGLKGGKWVHYVESTSRKCPENDKHPKIYKEWLVSELDYVLKCWNIIVTTNSMHTINILSDMIRCDVLLSEQVEINILSEDNSKINHVVSIDSMGYLSDNWPVGFLSSW